MALRGISRMLTSRAQIGNTACGLLLSLFCPSPSRVSGELVSRGQSGHLYSGYDRQYRPDSQSAEIRCPNSGVMLCRRLRRRPNITPAFGQRFLFRWLTPSLRTGPATLTPATYWNSKSATPAFYQLAARCAAGDCFCALASSWDFYRSVTPTVMMILGRPRNRHRVDSNDDKREKNGISRNRRLYNIYAACRSATMQATGRPAGCPATFIGGHALFSESPVSRLCCMASWTTSWADSWTAWSLRHPAASPYLSAITPTAI